jgi:hypothetical protein
MCILLIDLIVIGLEVVVQKGVRAVTRAVAGVLDIVVTAKRSHVGQIEKRARKRVNDNGHVLI